MSISIDSLRPCLEGAIPSAIATCDNDGIPNVAWLSQVQYVDSRHLALSFQFFSKTRANILGNAHAELLITDPASTHCYRLQVRYCRTETSGPLFENMKARLAGVASHTGMASVYRLQGTDIYEVLNIELLPSATPQPVTPRPARLPLLRTASTRLAACRDLNSLVDETLQVLGEEFGIRHAMVLMLDDCGQRLYAVASRGYESSGVGFEVSLGNGVIGVAARERTPIRISFMAPEYSYARAARSSTLAAGLTTELDTEIPFPGLAQPHSQLALPILAGERLHGVIYLESSDELRFDYDDEDALMALAAVFAAAVSGLETEEPDSPAPATATASGTANGEAVRVKHYAFDHSLFLDEDYVIKGLAGAILWRLLGMYREEGRTEFSNRELRLDSTLGLPAVGDNLEARLLLLQRRLAEREACVQIEKSGRGRFRLAVSRPLLLENIARP